jgi:hypothetical protein
MSALDVGAPVFTTRSIATLTGTNLSTAMRAFYWDDYDPSARIGERDAAIHFPSASGIHAQTSVVLDTPSPLTSIELGSNLHLLNPIGYNNKPITQVLLDFLTEQLHVGHGVIRLSPAGSGVTAQWTPVPGLSTHASRIDEPMDAANFTDYLTTGTPNAAERITFPTLPSNALRVAEALVAFFGSITKGPVGSDKGMGFGFQMQHASVGNISRKMIADLYGNGVIDSRRAKLDRIDQLPGVFNASWLNMTAEYGAAGGAPNPFWFVYCLEMLVYYEGTEPSYDIVDAAAHSALDARFTAHPLLNFGSWNLDCDVLDTTGYSALLDILAHAPELFYYIDYTGKLKPGVVGKYADVATPRALSTVDGSIIAVRRGPYRVDERYANAVELRWGVSIPQITSGAATEDPTNPPAERGNRKFIRGAGGVPVAGWEDRKILDRHFIRRDSNRLVAEAIAKTYLNMWGEENGRELTGLDLVCPYSALDVEPGDVVALTIPSLGLSGQNYLCVEKSIDLDKDELNLTVYDLEMTL